MASEIMDGMAAQTGTGIALKTALISNGRRERLNEHARAAPRRLGCTFFFRVAF